MYEAALLNSTKKYIEKTWQYIYFLFIIYPVLDEVKAGVAK